MLTSAESIVVMMLPRLSAHTGWRIVRPSVIGGGSRTSWRWPHDGEDAGDPISALAYQVKMTDLPAGYLR